MEPTSSRLVLPCPALLRSGRKIPPSSATLGVTADVASARLSAFPSATQSSVYGALRSFGLPTSPGPRPSLVTLGLGSQGPAGQFSDAEETDEDASDQAPGSKRQKTSVEPELSPQTEGDQNRQRCLSGQSTVAAPPSISSVSTVSRGAGGRVRTGGVGQTQFLSGARQPVSRVALREASPAAIQGHPAFLFKSPSPVNGNAPSGFAGSKPSTAFHEPNAQVPQPQEHLQGNVLQSISSKVRSACALPPTPRRSSKAASPTSGTTSGALSLSAPATDLNQALGGGSPVVHCAALSRLQHPRPKSPVIDPDITAASNPSTSFTPPYTPSLSVTREERLPLTPSAGPSVSAKPANALAGEQQDEGADTLGVGLDLMRQGQSSFLLTPPVDPSGNTASTHQPTEANKPKRKPRASRRKQPELQAIKEAQELVAPPLTINGKVSHSRKVPPGHVKRTPNAFILFRSHLIANKLLPPGVETDNRQISRVASGLWAKLNEVDRHSWQTASGELRAAARAQNPEKKAVPLKRREILRRRQSGKLPGETSEQRAEREKAEAAELAKAILESRSDRLGNDSISQVARSLPSPCERASTSVGSTSQQLGGIVASSSHSPMNTCCSLGPSHMYADQNEVCIARGAPLPTPSVGRHAQPSCLQAQEVQTEMDHSQLGLGQCNLGTFVNASRTLHNEIRPPSPVPEGCLPVPAGVQDPVPPGVLANEMFNSFGLSLAGFEFSNAFAPGLQLQLPGLHHAGVSPMVSATDPTLSSSTATTKECFLSPSLIVEDFDI